LYWKDPNYVGNLFLISSCVASHSHPADMHAFMGFIQSKAIKMKHMYNGLVMLVAEFTAY